MSFFKVGFFFQICLEYSVDLCKLDTVDGHGIQHAQSVDDTGIRRQNRYKAQELEDTVDRRYRD